MIVERNGRLRCDQCQLAKVNGVVCHEAGCPDRWQLPLFCKWCERRFVPERRGQFYCENCTGDWFEERFVMPPE